MSITIRLTKIGKRNAPAYKIVVSNTRDKRNGTVLDVIGHFNPSNNPQLIQIDKEKVETWKKNGALTTKAVDDLISGKYVFQPYTRQNEKKDDKTVEVSSKSDDNNSGAISADSPEPQE